LAGKPAAQAARAALSRVGLQERLHHYPKTLSGGEQQRVSLARAFVVQPRLLFVDEPTGSLDAHNGAMVIDLMFSLLLDKETTLIMVTHDQALADRCERKLLLQGGRLVAPERQA
jgi:putative ABC transport system ATP-binding protein